MAGKNFDFQGKLGWEKGWGSDFSKIRILEIQTFLQTWL